MIQCRRSTGECELKTCSIPEQ